MTTFPANPAHYRLRLLADLTKALVIPVVLLHLSLSWFDVSVPILYVPLLDVGFIIVCAVVRVQWREWTQSREARALNARQVPRVVGKWPGNIDVLLWMMKEFKTSYVGDVYKQLFNEYQCTTLNLRILWQDNIITMDQEHSKFILATGVQHFWRGRAQKERMETFLGTGIFNRDDEIWKAHRSTARPFFAQDRIRDFEIFEKYTSRTLSILSGKAAANEPCEAQDLFARFTLDAASEFLFSQSLDTLDLPFPVPGKATLGAKGSAMEGSWGAFAEAFESCQQNITRRARIGRMWPILELFEDKNEEHTKVIHDWLDPLVKRAIGGHLDKEKDRTDSASLAERTFMEHLAASANDPVIIRDQLLNMLLASRDTAACVLTYIIYFLALHPDVTEKLRAEVLKHCGPTSPGTFDNFRNMKYMRAVINETLRLFPPVPLNQRETRDAPCTLPPPDSTFPTSDRRPFYLPPETIIIYLPILIQRNPALWGEDADEFDPERWIDPKRLGKYVANPAMYAPFSAGPRIVRLSDFS
ncbi:hypothetical protein EST38_g8710 [Candolleomyces aberdarensis]|uniref:Uncharacterized protein n=1 Tax=Candolleomyces aberdarensis TaxID=2316362 RepID=A0A4Q2DBY7_9AGAR|nr:hypothetical protein EST38_g8710 [Candolleomyces aberdarensis]